MERPTPRVNSAKLADYPGKTVRIIGKVLSLDGESALIESSDGGQVVIKLSRTSHFSDQFVEVIGKVNAQDNSIAEFTSVNLGDNIDLALADQVVELTHAHQELFPLDK